MKTETPKSDALINELFDETGHVGPHNCPERWVRLCRGVEVENAKWRDVLANLMPFVLEDYYPNCATPAYKSAVEAAKDILSNDQDHR